LPTANPVRVPSTLTVVPPFSGVILRAGALTKLLPVTALISLPRAGLGGCGERRHAEGQSDDE
jgi:hypothetical protein